MSKRVSKIRNLFIKYSRDSSLRELAKEIKVSPATLSRFKNGSNISLSCFLEIYHWVVSVEKEVKEAYL